MNTFFRICIFICIGIIIFTLSVNFVNSLETEDGVKAFPVEYETKSNITNDNILSELTGLTDPNMNFVWLLVTSAGALVAVGVGIFTQSITPVGIYLFGNVFWTSWIRMFAVVNVGGMLPETFTFIFLAGSVFVFIAAVIGMLTGSG